MHTLLTLLFFVAGNLSAQDFPASADVLLSTTPFQGATVAAAFYSIDDGAFLYSRNPDLPLLPASTAKLATSAAALERLKPEFRFTTTLLIDKKDQGRRKLSALVWRGTGDPSISGRGRSDLYEIFSIWADSLTALGVSQIKRLVLDERYFEGPATTPAWPAEELSYWYEAQTSAISFNDNCVDLKFSPAAKPGRKPQISLTPDFGYIKVKNRAVTGPRSSSFTMDYRRKPGTNTVEFFGSIPAGPVRQDFVSVDDPARFAAETLKRVWKQSRLLEKIRLKRGSPPPFSHLAVRASGRDDQGRQHEQPKFVRGAVPQDFGQGSHGARELHRRLERGQPFPDGCRAHHGAVPPRGR
jgi:D-alanyl-D-alanine carboxypeptidase/D-alanyl-D-alanine-endopeptidase (penicillin-binding protein 4)